MQHFVNKFDLYNFNDEEQCLIMANVLYFECAEQEREVQKSYWMEHSVDLTLESMMLDSKAADLDKEERPEV